MPAAHLDSSSAKTSAETASDPATTATVSGHIHLGVQQSFQMMTVICRDDVCLHEQHRRFVGTAHDSRCCGPLRGTQTAPHVVLRQGDRGRDGVHGHWLDVPRQVVVLVGSVH